MEGLWIDDNAIVGQESDVMELKKDLMNQFECEDCRTMDEYVGCTIEKLDTGGIKFRQKVLLQSYRNEFDILKLKKFNTPAAPGKVLRKPDEGNELLMPAKQTQYHSGVGKGMHMMQYSWPDTYNAQKWHHDDGRAASSSLLAIERWLDRQHVFPPILSTGGSMNLRMD